MAKALSRQELLRYARAGAQARIEELRAELASLEAAFGTRGGAGRRGRPSGGGEAAPRRRKMSAAGRARIAAAAKKRWAKWRKEKGRE